MDALREDDADDVVGDQELMAAVAAALPSYLARRLRPKVTVLAGVLGLAGILVFIPPVENDQLSSFVAPTNLTDNTTAAPTPPENAPTVPTVTLPSVPSLTPSAATTGVSASGPDSPAPTSTSTTLPRRPLVITESAYRSVTGGTPAEQEPPDGGLPVQSASGQHLRRTFVRVTGDASVLRLRTTTGETSGADVPEIAACVVKGSWSATRGEALASGPPFDDADCALGTQGDDGSWSFDLSTTSTGAVSADGFALVPATGTTTSFDLVFSPNALPAA